MSEKNPVKPNEEKEKSKKGASDVVSSKPATVLKAAWTLERCKRYARRYPNEGVWASAAQASYKAAVAHGWLKECLEEQSRPHDAHVKRAA